MLVLTRKLNEAIIINRDIRITVVALRGNQVRLGIEAPESVSVLREELYERVHAGAGTGAGEEREHLSSAGLPDGHSAG